MFSETFFNLLSETSNDTQDNACDLSFFFGRWDWITLSIMPAVHDGCAVMHDGVHVG